MSQFILFDIIVYMPKFKFGKLVRDKIVDKQIASGAKPKYRQLSSDEHKLHLIDKIIEETKEIANASSNEIASEIADVQQAIDDLCFKYGLTKKEINKIQDNKINKNGAFKNGIYIESVEVNEKDKWTKYFRANSDRYPEIN